MLLRNSEKVDTFFNFSHMKTISWLVPCSVYEYVHSQTNHSTLILGILWDTAGVLSKIIQHWKQQWVMYSVTIMTRLYFPTQKRSLHHYWMHWQPWKVREYHHFSRHTKSTSLIFQYCLSKLAYTTYHNMQQERYEIIPLIYELDHPVPLVHHVPCSLRCIGHVNW